MHILFLGNVAAHWIALMSGIASVIIAIYETIKNRGIAARWFWVTALICLLFACDLAWQDEHRNAQVLESEKAAQTALANTCRENARVEAALYAGSQGLVAAQRETIDKQQLSNDRQQGDISHCVVSLGKMNPKVREEIVVISIPLYTFNKDGKLVAKFALLKSYATLLVVTTNEVEPRFHGTLKCDNAYTPISSPQLPGTSQTVFSAHASPNRISDREYEISATAAGTEWAPAHPAYLTVSTVETESPGRCSFIPME